VQSRDSFYLLLYPLLFLSNVNELLPLFSKDQTPSAEPERGIRLISAVKMSLERGLKAVPVACRRCMPNGVVKRPRRHGRGACSGGDGVERATKEEIMETSRKCQRSDSLKKAERERKVSGSAKTVISVRRRRQKAWLESTQRGLNQWLIHTNKSSRSSRLLEPIGLIESGCWWN
jgi:hypothetical protein